VLADVVGKTVYYFSCKNTIKCVLVKIKISIRIRIKASMSQVQHEGKQQPKIRLDSRGEL